jgi:hypothetical protein
MEANPRRALTRSLVIGAITVPAIAVVAVALSAQPEPPTTDPDPTPAAAAPAGVRTAALPQSVATTATGRDYRLACGREGRALVKRQQAGKANQVEEAALAALRPICEARGKPLPGTDEPAPEVVIETVAAPPAATVQAPPDLAVAADVSDDDFDDDSDDDWDEDDDFDDDSDDDRDDDRDEDDDD